MITKQTMKNIVFRFVLPKKAGTPVYSIIKSRMSSEDLVMYITYGIRASQDGKILAEIKDISPDFKAVQALADKCNRYQVSLLHFQDVVEDFILL